MRLYHKPNLVTLSYKIDDISTATLLRLHDNRIERTFRDHVELVNKMFGIKYPDNYFNNHDVCSFTQLLFHLKEYL